MNQLTNKVKAEILLRKTLSDFGLTSWEQYQNMTSFIKTHWKNTSNRNKLNFNSRGKHIELNLFTCELKFDYESFIERLKIKREYSEEFLDLTNIPEELLAKYPTLSPLLNYILNKSEEADINRRKFVKYVSGTEYSSSEMLILLCNTEIPFDMINENKLYRLPFLAHTCFSTLDLFLLPDSGNYQEIYNVKKIDEEITKGSSGLGVKN